MLLPGTGSQVGHLTGIKSLRSPENTVRQVPAAPLDQSGGPQRLRNFPKVTRAAKSRGRLEIRHVLPCVWGKATA